jgi:uncharacterized protein
MPVRSLTSSVFIWPDRQAVDLAARSWALQQAVLHPELQRLGYFGSYARGEWGVGSDLDLLAVVSHSSEPFNRRALGWDLLPLPVPAELLVYTVEEWKELRAADSLFVRRLDQELVWLPLS